MHDSPYLIVEGVNILAVRRVEVRADEVGYPFEGKFVNFRVLCFQGKIVALNRCDMENETTVR